MNERAHGLTEARPLLTPIEEVTKQTADALGKIYEEVSEPDYVQEEQERRAKLSPLERAVDNVSFIVDKIHPEVKELFERTNIDGFTVSSRTFLDVFFYREGIIYYNGLSMYPLGLGNQDYAGEIQKRWDRDPRDSRKILTEFGNFSKGEIVLKFINHLAEELK